MTRLRWPALAALYALGAVAFTWPMPAHLGTHLWGDRFDAWTTLWLMDHLAQPGGFAATTPEVGFPIGYNLWSFGHLALQAMAAPLLWAGLPLVATYNLLILAALVFSALSAHRLGEVIARAGGDAVPPLGVLAAGLLASATFTWSPILYGELRAGCVELVAAGFLPLACAAMIGVIGKPGGRSAAKLGLVVAITGPFNWYYAIFNGLLGGVVAAWQLLAGRRRAAGWLCAGLALAVILVSPLIPLVRRETPSRPAISAEQLSPARVAASRSLADGERPLSEIDEADLLDLDALQVVLNATPLSALLALDFPTNPLESTPGRLAWALGLVGAAAAGRRGLPWLALAGGFTLLTLGPYALPDRSLPIPAWSLEHPLPFLYLYNHVPFFSKVYRPYRLGVVVLTALAALSAAGLARLATAPQGRARGPAARGLLFAGGLALVWGAAQPALHGEARAEALAAAAAPPGYARLAGRPGALIEVPVQLQPVSVATAEVMLHQTIHRRPILNNNQLIRRTDLAAFQAYVAQNPLLASLVDLARKPGPWAFRPADRDAAIRDGFRDLVVRTWLPVEQEHLAGFQDSADRLGLAALRMLEEAFGPPWLEEGGVLAFDLGAGEGGGRWDAGKVHALSVPFAELGLPVYLQAGQALQLGAGEGAPRRVGLWIRGEGSFALRFTRGEQPQQWAVEAAEGWVWVRQELGGVEDSRPWRVDLVGEGRAWLARPELERW